MVDWDHIVSMMLLTLIKGTNTAVYDLQYGLSLHISKDCLSNCYRSLLHGDETIQRSILSLVNQVNVDVKVDLLQTISIVGGRSMLNGFKEQLTHEIQTLFESETRVKVENTRIINGVFPGESSAWTGASLIASLGVKGRMEIQKNNYIKDRQIPQWEDIVLQSTESDLI